MQVVGSWWEGKEKRQHHYIFHHPVATKEFTAVVLPWSVI